MIKKTSLLVFRTSKSLDFDSAQKIRRFSDMIRNADISDIQLKLNLNRRKTR